MKTGMRMLAGAILFLVPVAGARADVGLPPTLCLDFLYLDAPYRYIVGIAMFAGAISFGIWLRKKATPRLLAIAVPLILFVAADIGLYIYGLGKQNEARERYRKAVFQGPSQAPQEGKPKAPAGEIDATSRKSSSN